jgi:hypothetical protein
MFYATSTNPNVLINHVMQRLGARTDAHLGAILGIHPSGLTHIRNRKYGVSDRLIVAILHAIPEMTLLELQQIAGLSTEE